MTTDRKKPTAAFWITVALVAVLVVPFLYVLSFGPIYWLDSTIGLPEWAVTAEDWLILPRAWLYDNSPQPVRDAMDAYDNLWISY